MDKVQKHSSFITNGGTSKSKPSPHLHKVLTRDNKLSPRTLQAAVVNKINEF